MGKTFENLNVGDTLYYASLFDIFKTVRNNNLKKAYDIVGTSANMEVKSMPDFSGIREGKILNIQTLPKNIIHIAVENRWGGMLVHENEKGLEVIKIGFQSVSLNFCATSKEKLISSIEEHINALKAIENNYDKQRQAAYTNIIKLLYE